MTGCISSGQRSWPLQSYPYACHTGMLPDEPICLMSARMDGGFEYRDQFRACRVDIQTFETALNKHYRCTSTELRGMFDRLLREVPQKYNCYVKFFANNKKVPRLSNAHQLMYRNSMVNMWLMD